ncbi:Zinc protease [Labilithrix luteola]|uniref:Zinc protease n=1 Tax=Labilithrix luteola TaxID=1391654 RepID=A0A0K1QFM4_9BACT|nr:pitrilysin family protein [Labilithrix luteola]AKV04528.1 Zinc protease [Labilithrix luteola]
MTPRVSSILLPVLASLVFACGGSAPAPSAPPPPLPEKPVASAAPSVGETPDAPFRQQAPKEDGHVTFVPPKVDEFKLKNGIRVLLVERHELPIVAVRLVVGAGAGDIEHVRPGAISFLGGMLEQGTKKRTALQIGDDFDALGAAHGAWFEWDSGGASIKVLADKLDPALEIMSDVVENPTFPNDEIERLRARRIASIQAEKSSPQAIAQNTLAAAMFGRAHPYGHTLGAEEADAKNLKRDEIVRAYQQLFTPANVSIVVAGDISREALQPKLEAAFGSWKGKGGPAISKKGPKTPTKAAAEKRIVVVDKPGAQSQVQIARPGVPFSTKERDAIIVTNAILGGMFSSRINLNLREKHGYTYGARSYFVMRHGAGPFIVTAPVIAEKTIPSIKEIFNELDGLRQDGPTERELELAKESILLSMPSRFESVSDVASAISELLVYDLPLDDFAKRPARIEAVTAADVKRIAGEMLDGKQMTVVVVGDKKKLAPELEALGLGPIEERDPYGNPVSSVH